MERITLTAYPTQGYELLDSGSEEKLERYGDIVLARPDPQALWEKNLSKEVWAAAKGKYARNSNGWVGELPKEWPIEYGGLKFLIRPTSFKHTGLFPEQQPNWEWVGEQIERRLALSGVEGGKPVSVLNLFAYTGGATLACAQAGAEVTHVDASKTAVAWARENATLSNLADKPVRWMVEDVLVFVRREIKRGNRYDAIIMDPPAFGHGPKDELWKIEENFLELMQLCLELLTEKPLFVLMSGYAAGYSSLAFGYSLEPFAKKFGGGVECGDLTIKESLGRSQTGEAKSERLLPCGIFARWSNNIV